MKSKLITLTILILAVGLLVGCARPTAAPTLLPTDKPVVETTVPTLEPTQEIASTPITVVDALNRTVVFDQLPTRIAITGKAAFMIGNAAFLFPEATERIIGFVRNSQTSNDFITTVFPQTASMAVLETDSGAEQVAPLNPDLVLMKSYLKESMGDPIEKLGIKVVYLDLETPEAIIKDIQTLGVIFGNSKRAEEIISLIGQYLVKITAVSAKLTDEQKPAVLILQHSDKGGDIAFKVPPADWLQTTMMEMAGGAPVWKDVPTDGWTTITLEQIASWNPQYIFIVDYKGTAVDVVGQLKTDEKWALLDAVKNDRLFAFPSDFQSWDQPDMRWPLGLTWVADKLHPDLFTSVDLQSEIKAFYANFYGLSDSVINELILPLVKGDL